MNNKVLSHTNFSGIKYSNNPLTVDPNSFSNSNNVYLNKYNALISRPPIEGQVYPYQVYSTLEIIPDYLKLTGTYNLSNGGVIYVIFNTGSNYYFLRYKSPAGVYSQVIAGGAITSYKDFSIVQYKQYYIAFTVHGTTVLDTTSPSNSWVALSTKVDIPVTIIQTGNERLTLGGNQLTDAHKKQFIVKTDSDDTIYNLPANETAAVVFPSQTDITYNLTKANEYTRDRLIRKLNTPANSNSNTLLSISGNVIAMAHSDRVDISLDFGETFYTVVYPTVASANYKNTASLSDDGQCFFYVHSDGVYRYMLGTEQWDLIEVVTQTTEMNSNYWAPLDYSHTVERELTGLAISPANSVGANYGHFVNAEKFAFMLAYWAAAPINKWISVLYTKGLNITNLYGINFIPRGDLLNSFAIYTNSNTPLNIIGDNTTIWAANPYLNARLVRILDNDTAVFYSKETAIISAGIALKAGPAWLLRSGIDAPSPVNINLSYVAAFKHTLSFSVSNELNALTSTITNTVKLLVKRTSSDTVFWYTMLYTFSATLDDSGLNPVYTIVFTVTNTATDYLYGTGNSSGIIHPIAANKYLVSTTLQILDSGDTIEKSYTLSNNLITTTKVVLSGPYYIIYKESDNSWYTNIPLLATLTYAYAEVTPFNQAPPAAVYSDQNLWLAMGKTLWIGNLVDDKLSIPAINNNVFAKTITGIIPITATSKAIFFNDSITLCEQLELNDGSVVWQYYPLKFTVGIRQGDSVITTNDGKFTIFPTKYGLAVLTYQLNIAATEQAITYITDDIKTLWAKFYTASSKINIIHHNTQLILSNGTNEVLIYDFRTNGWYPQTFPTNIKINRIQSSASNHEILELQPGDAVITNLTGLYEFNKENDELYTYAAPYKDLGTLVIPWHLTSQLLLLAAPNNYKNISQLVIDQIDSAEQKQSAYLTTQIFRQRTNIVKPSIELIYNIDTFTKIVKKVNWWKVLGLKWQLENDATSSYPTQLRLYNLSITYDVSYEVK